MAVRRPPVPLLLPLFFPMLIASSSSMGSITPGRHRVFEAPCSLTSTNGSIKGSGESREWEMTLKAAPGDPGRATADRGHDQRVGKAER